MELVRSVLYSLIAAGSLLAQARALPNADELVRRSIRNGEIAWKDSRDYSCLKRDVTRKLNPDGSVKSASEDLYRVIPLGYHTSYQELIQHDNKPVPKEQLRKSEADLRDLEAETPAQKRQRFQQEEDARSYMKEVPDAFHFEIVGEETLPTGPAWVLTATPRPGFQPKSRYAHMFPSMRGKLWIDEKDVQWVKADAVAMRAVSFGFFIARLAKGSHIIIDQTRLPDGSWVPQRIEAHAQARVFVFFNHNFREDITYSDYRNTNFPAATR